MPFKVCGVLLRLGFCEVFVLYSIRDKLWVELP